MNSFLKIAAALFIACLLISFVKEVKKEYALYIAVACGIIAVLSSLSQLEYIKTVLSELIKLSGVSASGLKIFFKAVAITVISTLTSDACTDVGNRFLASCVDLCGKIAIAALALPLLNGVIEIISGYIGA